MDKEKLTLAAKKKSTAKSVTSAKNGKTKGFSVKTTPEVYDKLTKINRYYGMSTNSVINQLLVKYIRENQSVLDDLEKDG